MNKSLDDIFSVPEENQTEVFDPIVSIGTLEMSGVWVKIEVEVHPERETQKAYYGDVTVYDVDENGNRDCDIYHTVKAWVPKSMSANPWWICTNTFECEGRCANKRFDD